MKYRRTDVAGVTIIDIDPLRDDRGFDSDAFCAEEFAEHGLLFDVAQAARAYCYARGTLRGLHRQVCPHAEAKLVRFQTLADNTEVLCQVSGRYAPSEEQGFRWNDPGFATEWPLPVNVISEKDSNWPLLAPVGARAS